LVFDPALKHFSSAFRPLDSDDSDDWRTARRSALETVISAVSASRWAGSLVLRGSMLLAAWFADEAREPHDLDFVVVPPEWRIEEERTGTMLSDIASEAQRVAEARAGELTFDADGAESEYIWTYERVPGRRLVLPWRVPELPTGQVQLDFVFNEPLPVRPVTQTVGGAPLPAVTPQLSLAWKVQWLTSDQHVQGKDLYDAVLLAERGPLSYDLLREVCRLSGEWERPCDGTVEEISFDDVKRSLESVEWDHFTQEYPGLAGSEHDYVQRLLTALAPTFTA
jgi:hypothetical protein